MSSFDSVPTFGAVERSRPLVAFTRADKIEFKPTDWLVEHWLVRNTLAGLVGPSGAGKSFLAIEWACRVATGSRWIGNPVSSGAVFYLAGEGQQGIRKRIAAWESHYAIPIAGKPLFLADSLPFLTDQLQAGGTVAAIEEEAEAIFFQEGAPEPALIVIDTVARAMGGANENSAEDIGRLVSSMDWLRDRFNACVLAVHHTGHGSQDRARGSSAFLAALDSEFLMKPNDPQVTLSATKGKDWEKPSPVVLEKKVVPVEIIGTDGKPLRDSSLILQADTEAATTVHLRGQAFRLKKDGMTVREIAADLGVSKSAVQKWVGGESEY